MLGADLKNNFNLQKDSGLKNKAYVLRSFLLIIFKVKI